MRKTRFQHKNTRPPQRNKSPLRNQASPAHHRSSPSHLRTVVGIHAVKEALLVRPKMVTGVSFRQGYKSSQSLSEIAETAERQNRKIIEVSERQLNQYSDSHQGVMCEVAEVPELNRPRLTSASQAYLCALDQVEDPHNLGAILRSAWLLGIQGLICDKDRSSPLSPSVHKVASGGCEHVPVDFVSDLQSDLKKLSDAGFWIYGLASEAKQTIWDINFPGKVIVILGAEGRGLRKSTLKICDELVHIPQTSETASLNVSVAAAIAFGELARQRSLAENKGQ